MIELPNDVKYIIDTLEDAGFEGYAVGGCVRDSLMGHTPGDWDITTNAKPEAVVDVFSGKRVLPTGIKHGTVTLFIKKIPYEITSYRVDGGYSDGRRPDSVTFTSEITEDLSRRDFTVNAMAYSHKRGMVDPFGGGADLTGRLIRCVGKAEERFGEDYLRMLRAYRFSATLGFALDAEIVSAVAKLKERIHGISAERIRIEFDKILLSGNHAAILAFFRDMGEVLFPEVAVLDGIPQRNKYHYLNVYGHTMEVLRNTELKLFMRLTALFHDTGKALTMTVDENGDTHFKGHAAVSREIAGDILKRLKYDNNTIDNVTTLVNEHSFDVRKDRTGVKRLVNKLGETQTAALFRFAVADTMGKNHTAQASRLPYLYEDIRLLGEITREKEPCNIGDLAINGGDVMAALGVKPGKRVGEELNYLLEQVVNDPSLNRRDILLTLLKERNT